MAGTTAIQAGQCLIAVLIGSILIHFTVTPSILFAIFALTVVMLSLLLMPDEIFISK